MHEMSLALALVEQAEAAALRHGAENVQGIRLSVGALSGVDEEALRFCLPLAFEGTLLEGALVQIDTIPVEVECLACGARGMPDEVDYRCMTCKGGDIRIVSGRDFLLTSLEVT